MLNTKTLTEKKTAALTIYKAAKAAYLQTRARITGSHSAALAAPACYSVYAFKEVNKNENYQQVFHRR